VDASDNWLTQDIEVTIKPRSDRTSFKDGAYDFAKAVIRAVESPTLARVIILNESRVVESIPIDYLEPVKPEKKNSLKILLGEWEGQLGQLISVDGEDGIVKLHSGSGEFKMIPFRYLAKYTPA
jgi:transcription elongation factor SPT5